MDLLPSSWVALLALLLVLAAAVALVVALRQRNRVARQADELLRDIETLNDRLWALADSEERYRSLIEAQGDLIVRRDDGRIVYANAAYAALLGLDETSVIGSRREPERLEARTAQALEGGARVFDERLATPQGERWISWVETVVPVALGKTVLQRVGRDMSARIASEQALVEARARAESASETKSRFLATVSHEFRTPLNGILGMADLLGDTRLDPEQATYVGALRTSGEALLSLVDDILDVAKIEAGKLELAPAPFDPAQLIETVCELMAPRAQEKGLEIAASIAPDLPAKLIGDRDRLRQILLNLVGNAVKFTASGGVGISLRLRDGRVEIAVADSGPGIPQHRHAAIFEEFEQAETGATRSHAGTGLGLAIVSRLVNLMGGDIALDSMPGAGATFTVRLPLATAEVAPALSPPDWSGRRILIAASGPFGPAFLAQAVEAAGGEAVCCNAADAALAALRAMPATGAILIDRGMGQDTALQLAEAARQVGLSERLVLLTPGERRQDGAVLASAFTGFLIKPVRARSLYERLSSSRQAQPQPAPGARPSATPQPVGHPLNVLVAEDNDINALLVTRTLEKLGHRAIRVRDGRAALRHVEASLSGMEDHLDLVLLDIRMPELDGLSVARAIRARETRIGTRDKLPLLAVTANVSAVDQAEARVAGMDACLAKPLERAVLMEWLARVANRASATISPQPASQA